MAVQEVNMTTRNSFIRLPRVEERTGLSRSEIYRRMREGTFPQSHKLGSKTTVWLDADIDAWIEAQIAKCEAA
jgi:prophage regulatory protein